MDKIKVENYTEFMKGAMEDDWVQIDTPYFSFNVRSFIPLIEMMYLCDEVVDNCFADEAEKWFHPEVEEFEFRRAVIGAYTNIELPNDLPEAYAICMNTELFSIISEHINKLQLHAMTKNIHNMIMERAVRRRNEFGEAVASKVLSWIGSADAVIHDTMLRVSKEMEDKGIDVNAVFEELKGYLEDAIANGDGADSTEE